MTLYSVSSRRLASSARSTSSSDDLGATLRDVGVEVVLRLDVRADLDASRVMEVLALVQVRIVDDRLGDRLDLVFGRGLDERLLHELLHEVLLDLTAVHALEDRARDLAFAKALQRHAALQIAIGLVELAGHGSPGELDGNLLLDGGQLGDRNLHGASLSSSAGCAAHNKPGCGCAMRLVYNQGAVQLRRVATQRTELGQSRHPRRSSRRCPDSVLFEAGALVFHPGEHRARR